MKSKVSNRCELCKGDHEYHFSWERSCGALHLYYAGSNSHSLAIIDEAFHQLAQFQHIKSIFAFECLNDLRVDIAIPVPCPLALSFVAGALRATEIR